MNTEAKMLNQIREWLRRGATIKATDPDKETLVVREDGSVDGNLTITDVF